MTTPTTAPVSTAIFADPKQLAAHLQSQRASSGAQEFEASLFSSVLEKMEKNLSIEDSSDSDPGHDTWSALGVRAVSQALAQRHVLGIADMIEHCLAAPASGAASVAAYPSAPVKSAPATPTLGSPRTATPE
jgi:Rod binding domain-containing protein